MNSKMEAQFYLDLQKILPAGKTRKWISEVLASCPRHGDGVHPWLFITSLKLHRFFPEKEKLAEVIADATANCGRDVPDDEIWNAITNSEPIALGTASHKHRPQRWPARNEERIKAVIKEGPTLAQLEASSPAQGHDGVSHTEEVIDLLFPGNPLLCAGTKKESALTRSREEWRGCMQNQQFIVPSAMTSVYGQTKSGQTSMRTLSNVGQRRFLVVEFDQGDFDQHAALLVHLAKFAPLVLAVHSGNKSIHGWFYCAGQPTETVEKFFRYAVSLGADKATWTRCQFVRMPDGSRDNGVRQRIIYFNPHILPNL